MEVLKELPVLLFDNGLVWHYWLEENYKHTPGTWLKLAKKSSGKTSVSYEDTLEEAICFVWIDGQK